MMSQPIGRAVLVLSGLGFPLTQQVIRRFGRPGAVVVQTVCGGLLVRDVAMIAAGVPDRVVTGSIRSIPADRFLLTAVGDVESGPGDVGTRRWRGAANCAGWPVSGLNPFFARDAQGARVPSVVRRSDGLGANH